MRLDNAQVATEFRTFRHDVFRIDRTAVPMAQERTPFAGYLYGHRTPPTEYLFLKPWLAQLAKWRKKGKTFTRVRVVEDPPNLYQRWLLWGTPWMVEAGENIRYLTEDQADSIGLPSHEWNMFDGARVVQTGPNGTRILVTDRDQVAEYRQWREEALRLSIPAAEAVLQWLYPEAVR